MVGRRTTATGVSVNRRAHTREGSVSLLTRSPSGTALGSVDRAVNVAVGREDGPVADSESKTDHAFHPPAPLSRATDLALSSVARASGAGRRGAPLPFPSYISRWKMVKKTETASWHLRSEYNGWCRKSVVLTLAIPRGQFSCPCSRRCSQRGRKKREKGLTDPRERSGRDSPTEREALRALGIVARARAEIAE